MAITLSRITQISRTRLGSNYPVAPSTGIDLAAATLVVESSQIASQDYQFVIDPTGTKFYQIEYSPSPRILPADIYTPGLISTIGANYVWPVNAPGEIDNLKNSLAFSSDGTRFYLVGSLGGGDNVIIQRQLATAWEMPIGTPTSLTTSPTLPDFQGLRSLQFNSTGTAIFYLCSDFMDSMWRIRGRPLSVAWDTSTVGAINQEYNVGAEWTSFPLSGIHAFRFNEIGTRLYLYHGYRWVSQYNLGTPWNLSTMTYSGQQRDFGAISTLDYVSTGSIWVNTATKTLYLSGATTAYQTKFYQFSSP